MDVDDNESVAMLQYSAGGSTVSSNAGRMHIVRAQAVELDWMWQRDKTDARGRLVGGEEGTKSTEPSSRRRELENLKMARLKCCILLLLQQTAASVCVCV